MINKVEEIRKQYPEGTRVELLEDMVNPDTGRKEEGLTKGLYGEVQFVDDAANIHVKWDNGLGLSLIPGIDKFKAEEGQD